METVPMVGLAELINDQAVERGDPAIPVEIIDEVLTENDNARRRDWYAGRMSFREIYRVAVERQASRAVKH